MHLLTRLRRGWLLACLLAPPLFALPLLAQGQTNADDQTALTDSARGYWRVKTDYHSRATRVSFFTAQHELLYQEKIPDRYVKLTKRTVRQFDELLAKLADRHLVADQVKSYDLIASNRWVAPPQPMLAATNEPERTMPSASTDQLSVNLLTIPGKKLRLTYQNSTGQPLLITITNASFHRFYLEKSRLQWEDKVFNLSHLASGSYRFEVENGPQKVKYNLIIPEAGGRIELDRVTQRSAR